MAEWGEQVVFLFFHDLNARSRYIANPSLGW